MRLGIALDVEAARAKAPQSTAMGLNGGVSFWTLEFVPLLLPRFLRLRAVSGSKKAAVRRGGPRAPPPAPPTHQRGQRLALESLGGAKLLGGEERGGLFFRWERTLFWNDFPALLLLAGRWN